VRTSSIEIEGREFPIALWSCSDPEAAAEFLLKETDKDDGGPLVDLAARGIAAIETDDHGPLVQSLVQGWVEYLPEPWETFQKSEATLRMRTGDCDDSARLAVVLARKLGLPARLVIMRRDGTPVHAVAQIADRNGVWQWAETTVLAHWGESPIDAKRRLGAIARTDL
jgi:hypothetical protein